ncbi:MAG: hypothetical protein WA974_16395 [Thermodesulfobacteriota bacterium]
MLARQRNFRLQNGNEIQLPLLVPAFSSKGFKLIKKKDVADSQYSEVAYELADFGRYHAPSVLISAYDIYFHHFDAHDLHHSHVETYLRNSDVVFLDSGGYELATDFDNTEPLIYQHSPKEGFEEVQYRQVLKEISQLPEPLPLIIANFDHAGKNKTLDEQIELARHIFEDFRCYMSDFLIKPWSKSGGIVTTSELSDENFASLRGFDIIGVTEKELGRDLIDRLRRIARLRKGLDEAGINAPIHIWGGLDPLITPLFFFAGAEIFDGISWLRYSFKDGVAINRECHALLSPTLGVSTSRDENHAHASLENLSALRNMAEALTGWVLFEGNSFDMFSERVREPLRMAYSKMVSRIEALRRRI